ncbi:MAG: hypothetical protein GY951_05700 [Psychromonas sp.]|nr:hypothetical protein [Psychromonas sp.]
MKLVIKLFLFGSITVFSVFAITGYYLHTQLKASFIEVQSTHLDGNLELAKSKVADRKIDNFSILKIASHSRHIRSGWPLQ